MRKEYIIPIFVPHLGCPNDCVFCNQKKISGQLKQVTGEDVHKTIDSYLEQIKEESSIEVAFFGGSFTAIQKDIQLELLNAVQHFIEQGKVNSIRISTRPDGIDKEVLRMLKKYNVKTIELGVQSMNDFVLESSNRGHTSEDVIKASKLIRSKGFVLGHQMMIGLPESVKTDEIETAKKLSKLKPSLIRIYPVLVIKDTKLEQDCINLDYTPLTVEQAVERCKEVVEVFNKCKINIIRVGLQNTDEISDPGNKESQVVAGPYHPAFRQLVEASLWYDSILREIKNINNKVSKIKIVTNFENINNIIGHKKENVIKLKEVYDLDMQVEADDSIKPGKFKIEVLKQSE